ncbi:histone-lysine N-methyltransferase SETMAR [Elysia marginata]|uniref:Histone-lysine N-methyltransferase SETMAR n=1 Tax=Elysia marginata TaxID=1093978 RepID=A0AAV4HP51_9GAST|nr:histone-lysine N-methyltransferase SETMAR [Elysia marginata]
MATHLETWSKEEIRAVIRFLNAKSLNPTEILPKELQSVYGEHVVSRTQVYHWCNLFEAGHSDLTDWEGRGRLITATSEDNVKRVDELIRQDRRLKLHEIASRLEISETSAHRIIFDELGYRKKAPRAVDQRGHFATQQRYTPHSTSDAMLAGEIWMGDFAHPPYSPELAPSDYRLFGPLKREQTGKRFDDDEELVDHVQKWLQNLDGSFFPEGIYSMVPRWQKCVDRLGCYVENEGRVKV